MTATNAAREFGLTTKGDIQIGFDADLVVWDETQHVAQTVHRGELRFHREETI